MVAREEMQCFAVLPHSACIWYCMRMLNSDATRNICQDNNYVSIMA